MIEFLKNRYKFDNNQVERLKEENFQAFDELKINRLYKWQSGTGPKEFCRCSGVILLGLFDKVRKNPKTRFVTCANDFIINPTTNVAEFAHQKFSCILKTVRGNDSAFLSAEVIASQVCEIMGVKTSYITAYDMDQGEYVCVDFLSRDQKFELLGEFYSDNYFGYRNINTKWLPALINRLDEKIPKTESNREQIIDDFVTDFIRHLLVRRYILNDGDFHERNLGVVHDKGKYNYSLAPAFDFEYCLNELKADVVRSPEETMDDMVPVLRYLQENHPRNLAKAMSDISISHPHMSFINITKGVLTPYKSLMISTLMSKRLKLLRQNYKEVCLLNKQNIERGM